MRRFIAISTLLTLAACGPSVSVGADESTGTTSTTGETVSPTTTPSTVTAPTTVAPTTEPSPTSSPSDSSDSSDSGPMTFIQPTVSGGDPSCSVWDQDCPDGDKCMPWANDGGGNWNATRCSPIDPNPVGEDAECMVEVGPTSGFDNCDAGLMCFYVDSLTNIGTCVPFCTGDESNPMCEDPDDVCPIGGDSVLAVCLPTCHPLTPACPLDQVCVPYSDRFLCAPSVGDAAHGDECNLVNECTSGHACVNGDTVSGCDRVPACCALHCDVNVDPALQCPGFPQEQCVPWYDPPDAAPTRALENLGICTIAPP